MVSLTENAQESEGRGRGGRGGRGGEGESSLCPGLVPSVPLSDTKYRTRDRGKTSSFLKYRGAKKVRPTFENDIGGEKETASSREDTDT